MRCMCGSSMQLLDVGIMCAAANFKVSHSQPSATQGHVKCAQTSKKWWRFFACNYPEQSVRVKLHGQDFSWKERPIFWGHHGTPVLEL